MELKTGAVLLIFIAKMSNRCTIMRRCLISLFFRGIVLEMREKNTTFADEKGVPLINAEHCRI